MGVVLYNCFTGHYPETQDARGNFDISRRKEGQWSSISEDAKNIIRETLRAKADERPSAHELLHQRNWMAKTDRAVQKALETIDSRAKKS